MIYRVLLAGFFLAFGFTAHGEDVFRTWTSADGRKLEAALVGVEGDQVKLKLRTGAVSAVPLSRLSAEDQAFAKQNAAPAAGIPAPAGAGPSLTPVDPALAAEKSWPRTVSLEDAPKAETVKEDAATKQFVYRTPHYEFQCDSRLGANVVREFSRIFEATFLVNCKLPLDLRPAPEAGRELFLARLFTNKDDYFNAGGVPNSAGTYSGGKDAILVPLDSLGVKMVGSRVSLENGSDDDNRTLVHEITHQMMNHWLPKLPTWFTEGSAEFVAMAKYDRGKFSFVQMEDRLRDYLQGRGANGKQWRMLKPAELMLLDGRTWAGAMGSKESQQNYGSAATLAFYFYLLDGAGEGADVIAWLRDLANAKNRKEAEPLLEKHLIRGRSPEQLEKDIITAFRKKGLDVEFESRGITQSGVE